MEITICDQSTKSGRKGCFNSIAPLLKQYAKSCVVQGVGGSYLHPVNSHDFFDRLTRYGIWCKIFTNEDEFLHELQNVQTIKEIYGDHFATYTTFYEYNGFIGFKIGIKDDDIMFKVVGGRHNSEWEKNATPIIYVVLQHKCNEVDQCSDFEKLANDIIPALDLLHEKNYLHNDVFPNNTVSCDGQFKLIDYGDIHAKNNIIWDYWSWIERYKLSRMKFMIEWPMQSSFITSFIMRYAPVGIIAAVGLCTWWLHDQMIVNKKK